jgi:hypothetical protein
MMREGKSGSRKTYIETVTRSEVVGVDGRETVRVGELGDFPVVE